MEKTMPDNERSRKMIARPLNWPAYPKLPLMRLAPRAGKQLFDDCGYLWAFDSTPFRVHIGNILMGPTGETEVYDSADDLLAHWRID
jgi:hypothetical protein